MLASLHRKIISTGYISGDQVIRASSEQEQCISPQSIYKPHLSTKSLHKKKKDVPVAYQLVGDGIKFFFFFQQQCQRVIYLGLHGHHHPP